MDRDHVRMAHRRRGLGFAQEATPGIGVCRQFGSEDLHRDDPVELRVQRAKHDPHPAAADDVDDLIRPQRPKAAGLVAGAEEVERHLVPRRCIQGTRRTVSPGCRLFEKATGVVIGAQQGFHSPPLFFVGAGFVQEGPAWSGSGFAKAARNSPSTDFGSTEPVAVCGCWTSGCGSGCSSDMASLRRWGRGRK